MQARHEEDWRQVSDLVIAPDLRAIEWDGFDCGPELVKAGETAALEMLPVIQSWFSPIPTQLSGGKGERCSEAAARHSLEVRPAAFDQVSEEIAETELPDPHESPLRCNAPEACQVSTVSRG